VDADLVKTFLDRYRDVRAADAQQVSCELDRLRATIDSSIQERNKCAPDFNIFSILDVERKEYVHSNFLAHLLEPRGKHGQRALFLDKFLKMCGYTADITPWHDQIWVRREATIFEGRFDILIHAPGHLCWLIENKIHAPESDTQLEIYEKWLRDRREPQRDKRLVFLTLHGTTSKHIPKKKYLPLSYDKHIRSWLTSCREDITASHVQWMIDQYLSAIGKL
jgi:hypothetical protein